MNLSGGRYPHLVATLAGYLKTGVPLIEIQDEKFLPCITNDDVGIYFFIPKLAKFFNLNLDQTINLFFYGIIFTAVFLGAVGFFLYYRNWIQRAIALLGLLVNLHLMVTIGDVYAMGPACAITLLPFFLYFIGKNKNAYSYLIFFLFPAGIIIGFSNYLRAYCGIPVFLFMGIMVFFKLPQPILKKLRLMFVLCLGMTLPTLYINNLYQQYEVFAAEHLPSYKNIRKNHVFFHTLYCGFGFLSTMNQDGIEFSDKFAHEKVASINPAITHQFDEGYDAIIQNEVLNLVKHQRYFVLLTIFAKLGVLIFFLLKYANFGLIAAFIFPKGLVTELAFLAMLLFNTLYIMVAIPLGVYSINFMVAATLYGVISLNYALGKGLLTTLRLFFSSILIMKNRFL